MKTRITAYALAGCLSLGLGGTAPALEYHLRGQVSGWHIEAQDEGERLYSTGIRYIPELDLTQDVSSESFVDLEVSANLWAAVMSADPGDTAAIDLYRLKLRYATAMTETRLGLQTMNFGPAHLLRPLRWFDRLDPRDPLNLSGGCMEMMTRRGPRFCRHRMTGPRWEAGSRYRWVRGKRAYHSTAEWSRIRSRNQKISMRSASGSTADGT